MWENGIKPTGADWQERTGMGRIPWFDRWDGQGAIWDCWIETLAMNYLNRFAQAAAYPELWAGTNIASLHMGVWLWVTPGSKRNSPCRPPDDGTALGGRPMDDQHGGHYFHTTTVQVAALGIDPVCITFLANATWGQSGNRDSSNWIIGTPHLGHNPGTEKTERALFTSKAFISVKWSKPLVPGNFSSEEDRRTKGLLWHRDLLAEQEAKEAAHRELTQKQEEERAAEEARCAARGIPAPPPGEPAPGSWAPLSPPPGTPPQAGTPTEFPTEAPTANPTENGKTPTGNLKWCARTCCIAEFCN